MRARLRTIASIAAAALLAALIPAAPASAAEDGVGRASFITPGSRIVEPEDGFLDSATYGFRASSAGVFDVVIMPTDRSAVLVEVCSDVELAAAASSECEVGLGLVNPGQYLVALLDSTGEPLDDRSLAVGTGRATYTSLWSQSVLYPYQDGIGDVVTVTVTAADETGPVPATVGEARLVKDGTVVATRALNAAELAGEPVTLTSAVGRPLGFYEVQATVVDLHGTAFDVHPKNLEFAKAGLRVVTQQPTVKIFNPVKDGYRDTITVRAEVSNYLVDALTSGSRWEVRNAKGTLVATSPITKVGRAQFTWNGAIKGKPAPAGTYTIRPLAVYGDASQYGKQTTITASAKRVVMKTFKKTYSARSTVSAYGSTHQNNSCRYTGGSKVRCVAEKTVGKGIQVQALGEFDTWRLPGHLDGTAMRMRVSADVSSLNGTATLAMVDDDRLGSAKKLKKGKRTTAWANLDDRPKQQWVVNLNKKSAITITSFTVEVQYKVLQ